MNETYVTVVGNVATAVKASRLPSGNTVATFRIASNELRRRAGADDEWTRGDSLFVQVTCWRQLAENVIASLGVGDPVVVRGRLYTDEFEWEGKRRYEIRLEGHAIGPDLRRCKAAVTRVRRGDPAAGSAVDGAAVGGPLSGQGGATDVWPSADAGRAVPRAARSELAGAGGPSDDQGERLGAPVEAGVGA